VWKVRYVCHGYTDLQEPVVLNVEPKRSRPDNWVAAITMLLLRLLLWGAVAYVLYRVGFIIVVVLMAVMLALTVAPVVDRLRKSRLLAPFPKGLRRGAATTLVFAALALILIALSFFILRPLTAEVSQFMRNWTTDQARLAELFRWWQERYTALHPDLRAWIEQHAVRDLGTRAAEQLQHLVSRTLESGMLIVELILIPVLAFSFLTEGRPLKRELTAMLPRGRVRQGLYLLKRTGAILQSYSIGQLILALIAGVVVYFLMTGLGIRYALALAVVAAITRVIPVIGPVIGAVPIVLISAIQGLDRALIVLVAFTLMHLVESKVVMPKLIGHRINLHPAVVIVALLMGAEFFGMWGMFLAAPFAAVIRECIHYFLVRPRRQEVHAVLASTALSLKDTEVERPTVAGVGTHSRAH
jgi:predicted PurR-regulated permease PerM